MRDYYEVERKKEEQAADKARREKCLKLQKEINRDMVRAEREELIRRGVRQEFGTARPPVKISINGRSYWPVSRRVQGLEGNGLSLRRNFGGFRRMGQQIHQQKRRNKQLRSLQKGPSAHLLRRRENQAGEAPQHVGEGMG